MTRLKQLKDVRDSTPEIKEPKKCVKCKGEPWIESRKIRGKGCETGFDPVDSHEQAPLKMSKSPPHLDETLT